MRPAVARTQQRAAARIFVTPDAIAFSYIPRFFINASQEFSQI